MTTIYDDAYYEKLRAEARRPPGATAYSLLAQAQAAAQTDAQLRDLAVSALHQTTVGYINSHWKVPPAGTNWKAALDLLAQIGAVPPPPPPPPTPSGPDANARHLTSLGIDGNGVTEDDFYVSGGFVNIVGTNATVSRFNVGPSNDSNIIVEDGAHGAHIHDGVVHACGTPRVHTWGDHGIYGSADGLLVERVESYGQQSFGQSFSPRWNSIYDECYSHDSYAGIGVFDYSNGLSNGVPLLYARYLMTQMTGWASYIDTVRSSHQTGTVGPNTLCVEHYHSTLDLRGESTVPFNYSGDPIDGGSSFYNCIIIWDGAANAWYRSPKHVNLAGNVVLTSAQVSQWLNADWTPKKVVGSPIIGKAVATTGRGHSTIGELGDVGRYQTS